MQISNGISPREGCMPPPITKSAVQHAKNRLISYVTPLFEPPHFVCQTCWTYEIQVKRILRSQRPLWEGRVRQASLRDTSLLQQESRKDRQNESMVCNPQWGEEPVGCHFKAFYVFAVVLSKALFAKCELTISESARENLQDFAGFSCHFQNSAVSLRCLTLVDHHKGYARASG